MTTASRFSRQSEAGLRALNVVQGENFVLVVVLVLECKALYYLCVQSSGELFLYANYTIKKAALAVLIMIVSLKKV